MLTERIKMLNESIQLNVNTCSTNQKYSNHSTEQDSNFLEVSNPMRPSNALYLIQRKLTNFVLKKQTPHILMSFGNVLCSQSSDNRTIHSLLEDTSESKELDQFIEYMINESDDIEEFESSLNIMIFQILFTLATIQKLYPTFRLNRIPYSTFLFVPVPKIAKNIYFTSYTINDDTFYLPPLRIGNQDWELRLNPYLYSSIVGSIENLGVVKNTSPNSYIQLQPDKYIDMFHTLRIIEYLIDQKINVEPSSFKFFIFQDIYLEKYVQNEFYSLNIVTPPEELSQNQKASNPFEALMSSYFANYKSLPEGYDQYIIETYRASRIPIGNDEYEPIIVEQVNILGYTCNAFSVPSKTRKSEALFFSSRSNEYSPLFENRKYCTSTKNANAYSVDEPFPYIEKYVFDVLSYTDIDTELLDPEKIQLEMENITYKVKANRIIPKGIQYTNFLGFLFAIIAYEKEMGQPPFNMEGISNILNQLYDLQVDEALVYDSYAQLMHYVYDERKYKVEETTFEDTSEFKTPQLLEYSSPQSYEEESEFFTPQIQDALSNSYKEGYGIGGEEYRVSSPTFSLQDQYTSLKDDISSIEAIQDVLDEELDPLTYSIVYDQPISDIKELLSVDLDKISDALIERCRTSEKRGDNAKLKLVLDRLSENHPDLSQAKLRAFKKKANDNKCKELVTLLNKYIKTTPRSTTSSRRSAKPTNQTQKEKKPTLKDKIMKEVKDFTIRQIRSKLKDQGIDIPTSVRTKKDLLNYVEDNVGPYILKKIFG